MTIHECEQRSEQWYALRAGRVTGSCAADMLATLKGKGEAAARRDLRYRLVVERLTGIPQDDANGYVNAAMQRGIDLEGAAIEAYEAATGALVRRTGFISHDELAAGCSLDGDIDGCTGILEVKCPKSATHLATVRSGEVPSFWMPQIVHNLWVTGAQWCDFVSFDDRFPPELSLIIIRLPRVAADLAAYELVLRQFLAEVDAEFEAVETLRNMRRTLANGESFTLTVTV